MSNRSVGRSDMDHVYIAFLDYILRNAAAYGRKRFLLANLPTWVQPSSAVKVFDDSSNDTSSTARVCTIQTLDSLSHGTDLVVRNLSQNFQGSISLILWDSDRE